MSILLDLGISILLLAVSLLIALKKRVRNFLYWGSLCAGTLWLPSCTLRLCLWGNVPLSWSWNIFSMIWLSLMMVLGLCLMYGSKTIHFFGRDLVIMVLSGVILLLGTLILSFWY